MCVASLPWYNLLWFPLLLQYIVILVAWPEELDASYFHQYNLLKNDNRLCTDYIYIHFNTGLDRKFRWSLLKSRKLDHAPLCNYRKFNSNFDIPTNILFSVLSTLIFRACARANVKIVYPGQQNIQQSKKCEVQFFRRVFHVEHVTEYRKYYHLCSAN